MYQNIFVTNRTEEEPSTVYLFDDIKGVIILPYSEFDYAYRRDPNGTFKSIYGQNLKRVYSWNRDVLDVYESDVPRETRVLTDLYLDSDEVSTGHNIGHIDIEVSSIGGFPNVEQADKEILSIAMYNTNTNEYVMFILDSKHRIQDRQYENISIVRCDTEKELLQTFLAWYSEQKFTILTGWNVYGFDIPYLYHRLKLVLSEDDAVLLSPVGLVKWSDMRQRYQIAGVAVLDYLEMYKKFTYTTRPNYRLGTIGEYEVNINKVDLGMSIDDVYEKDIEKFIRYNLQDVEITVALDKKMKLIELVRGICHIGHVQYEDFMYSSKFIEGTILTYLHRKHIISPNKPVDGQEQMRQRIADDEEGFAGAYVKEPVPGLYKWVYSLDLQSLYPSIIMSLNISPETKIGKVLNWNIEAHMRNEITSYEVEIDSNVKTFNRDTFVQLLNKMKFSISSSGILYSTDQEGIIPEILKKWFSERAEYKKLMKKYLDAGDTEQADYYDRRQHVQKIFLNSIYGVLGLPIFRFYDIDNALSVTATGQDVIKTSARYVNDRYAAANNLEKKDYCIYIDTDSLYFSSENYGLRSVPFQQMTKQEFTIDLAQKVEEMLNVFYDWMAKAIFFIQGEHRFVIKGETVAKTGFWISKKRYALLKTFDLDTKRSVNKIIIKGLDTVRSSFPPAFSQFMTYTLDNILNEHTKDDIDKTVISFLKDLPSINYVDVAKNTSVKDLSKYDEKGNQSLLAFKKATPAHVKAALVYNRYITTHKLEKKYSLIRDGDKIKWVYLRNNPLQVETIAFKGFDDPKDIITLVEKYTDYDKLFDNELKRKLEDFYTAMGWGEVPLASNEVINEFFQFS